MFEYSKENEHLSVDGNLNVSDKQNATSNFLKNENIKDNLSVNLYNRLPFRIYLKVANLVSIGVEVEDSYKI